MIGGLSSCNWMQSLYWTTAVAEKTILKRRDSEYW